MPVATIIAEPTLTQLRVAMLFAWARAGMVLARRLGADGGRGLVGAAARLLRVAQAVRLALALALRLGDPADPLHQPAPARVRAARADGPEAEGDKPDPPEPVEKPTRFRAEPTDAVILRRPLAAIVNVICKALGVSPDWGLWSDPALTPTDARAEAPAPCALPEPRPRPRLVLDRTPEPTQAPPGAVRLAHLRSSSSPLVLAPCAAPARGRVRLGEAHGASLHWDREPSGSPFPTAAPPWPHEKARA